MTRDDVFTVFDVNGLLSSSVDSFEFREDQLNMALDVYDCFEKPCIATIEAGTGIGKSFAYLVPAMFKAFEDPQDRTVIATSTINLQRQLIEKDIPQLFKMFNKECSVSLAVGRNNYLCKRRLTEELRAIPLFATEDNDLSKLNVFASETETGLKSDYEGRLDPSLWASVCSDSDFCMGPKCPFFSECFYFNAKKKLSQSSIIICNHHLLFVDSSTRLETNVDYSSDCILPPFQRLIIDEAHNTERHATDLFTTEFSSNLLRRQLDYIYDAQFKNQSIRLIDQLASYCTDKDIYREIADFYALTITRAEALNMNIVNMLQANKIIHILLNQQNAPKIMGMLKEYTEPLIDSASRLSGRLSTFASKIMTDDEAIKLRTAELEVHIGRITALVDTLKQFADWQNWNEDVHYIELEKRGNTISAVLKVSPIDVAPVLKEALFNKIDSILCTSATMDLNDDFGYFNRSVGLPAENKASIKKVYSSPFDYKNRLMLLTPYDAPDFNNDNQQEYAKFLCTSIYNAAASSGGGALVLFTSINLMDFVYENVSPMLEAIGINTYRQGDCDRFTLLEKFKSDTDSVLFATDSFWEGVDAPGNTLRLVIITKLPFRMPDEPIYKARYRVLEEKGQSGFYSLSLPDATMKLKQGFGRLMRHTDDRGIVLILDSRIVKKSYGSMMVRSLPESYCPEVSIQSISDRIESFLF